MYGSFHVFCSTLLLSRSVILHDTFYTGLKKSVFPCFLCCLYFHTANKSYQTCYYAINSKMPKGHTKYYWRQCPLDTPRTKPTRYHNPWCIWNEDIAVWFTCKIHLSDMINYSATRHWLCNLIHNIRGVAKITWHWRQSILLIEFYWHII